MFAPLAQGEDHGQQPFALWGQRVDDFAAVQRIGSSFENSAGDHLAEPVGQDVSRNPQTALEFLEMLKFVQCSAQDQKRPFLSDELDRGGNRARQRRFAKRAQMLRWLSAAQAIRLFRFASKHKRIARIVALCNGYS